MRKIASLIVLALSFAQSKKHHKKHHNETHHKRHHNQAFIQLDNNSTNGTLTAGQAQYFIDQFMNNLGYIMNNESELVQLDKIFIDSAVNNYTNQVQSVLNGTSEDELKFQKLLDNAQTYAQQGVQAQEWVYGDYADNFALAFTDVMADNYKFRTSRPLWIQTLLGYQDQTEMQTYKNQDKIDRRGWAAVKESYEEYNEATEEYDEQYLQASQSYFYNAQQELQKASKTQAGQVVVNSTLDLENQKIPALINADWNAVKGQVAYGLAATIQQAQNDNAFLNSAISPTVIQALYDGSYQDYVDYKNELNV